jgi:deferrochelatase/peroxidase EfeB
MTTLNSNCESRQPKPVLHDIQGLVLRGYTFPYIRYIVFNITNQEGAKAFFAKILPGASDVEITSAKQWDKNNRPRYSLNIGFTYSGLETLMNKADLKSVENESSNIFDSFMEGAVANAGNIGDTGISDPAEWWKGSAKWLLPTPKPSDTQEELHLMISIYADSVETREEYHQKVLSLIPEIGGTDALLEAYIQDSNPLDAGEDYIHFGYKDSFSQPRLSDVPWNTNVGRLMAGKGLIDDRPCVPPYQFVITPPFNDPIDSDKDNISPKYKAHPLLYNGSFAAFRVLHQDVKAFKEFINKPHGEGITPELVAAKMCGRWFDGTPLIVSPDKPYEAKSEDDKLEGFDFTNFNYLEPTAHQRGDRLSDEFGKLCPYAAHIRRTNPRDDYKVKGNENHAENKRIMRRAGPYGPDYIKPDGIPRGLVGLFICADLSAQFNFIMHSWVIDGGFRTRGKKADRSPNDSGVDPVFGADDGMDKHKNFAFLPPGSPEQPTTQDYKVLDGLPQFIRTDGGLYLFLPGIEGLRHLANGTIPKP